MRVYQEGTDDKPEELGDEHFLPHLKEGDKVKLEDITCHQHFTEPPPRYSEATLIKALEEHGIGRPSTYASIVSTLQTGNMLYWKINVLSPRISAESSINS